MKNVNSLTAGIIVFPGSNCDRDANFALTINGFEQNIYGMISINYWISIWFLFQEGFPMETI